ncbi:hypothetical protein PsYK624_165850 [Phanerochaete sordida]|uniref:Uncharacterized protein n=1 Tax=Phanerochaete sordida TaxID=48140 RepID=A0A9P3LMD0_9APHY|nr:hypothetical protein PsYK624_165850 [Phanerochaete sordida]
MPRCDLHQRESGQSCLHGQTVYDHHSAAGPYANCCSPFGPNVRTHIAERRVLGRERYSRGAPALQAAVHAARKPVPLARAVVALEMGGDNAMMHGSKAAIVDAYATRAGSEQPFSTRALDLSMAIARGDSWILDTLAGAAVCRVRAHGSGVEPDGAVVPAVAACMWGLTSLKRARFTACSRRTPASKSCSALAAICSTSSCRSSRTRRRTPLCYCDDRLQRTQPVHQVCMLRSRGEGVHCRAFLVPTSQVSLLAACAAYFPVRITALHRAGGERAHRHSGLPPQGTSCQSRAQAFSQASSYTAEAQIM